MGRTNGKLTTFLKDALLNDSFCNLKWQDKNSQIFTLKLPRFEKRKDLRNYERILSEWYIVNNREYLGYSQAKAVIQAALKKSVYLVSLGRNSNGLHFRFATKAEAEEKRRKQASESKLILHDPLHKASLSEESEIFLYEMDFPSVPPLPSPNPPPSDSSGYQSGSEDSDENMPVDSDENTPVSEEVSISEDNSFLDAVDDLLKNPDSYINALNNITMDLENNYSPNGIIEDSIDPIPISPYDISENSIDTVPIPPNVITEDKHDVVPFDIKLNDAKIFQPFNDIPGKPVIELTATEVNSSKIQSTYWLCTRKLHIDSTLLLICEKQVILNEGQGFIEGQIYLNNVLKPGESYNLQKMLEFDGKCFLFLLRNN